jgi:hypothetical protein
MISSYEKSRIYGKALSGSSSASMISETMVPQSSSGDLVILFFTMATGLSFFSKVKREETSDVIENEYNNLKNSPFPNSWTKYKHLDYLRVNT